MAQAQKTGVSSTVCYSSQYSQLVGHYIMTAIPINRYPHQPALGTSHPAIPTPLISPFLLPSPLLHLLRFLFNFFFFRLLLLPLHDQYTLIPRKTWGCNSESPASVIGDCRCGPDQGGGGWCAAWWTRGEDAEGVCLPHGVLSYFVDGEGFVVCTGLGDDNDGDGGGGGGRQGRFRTVLV